MLNENLARVRKERGLTQEALAVKLNVVRQTISKWENGLAVPDADTLCRIADALEVSVAELLGATVNEDKTDMAVIAKSLGEINEQLAIKNRRSERILKVVCGIAIGSFILMAVLIILNISTGKTITDKVEAVNRTEVVDEVLNCKEPDSAIKRFFSLFEVRDLPAMKAMVSYEMRDWFVADEAGNMFFFGLTSASLVDAEKMDSEFLKLFDEFEDNGKDSFVYRVRFRGNPAPPEYSTWGPDLVEDEFLVRLSFETGSWIVSGISAG